MGAAVGLAASLAASVRASTLVNTDRRNTAAIDDVVMEPSVRHEKKQAKGW
jgi:hypothetical protein